MAARTCKLGKLLGSTHTLSQPDRALLRGWLDNGRDTKGVRRSADAISAALLEDGHTVGPTTLKLHRTGGCACFRGAA